MRFPAGILGLLACVTVGAIAQTPAVPEAPGVKVGAKLPGFQLPDQNGKAQTLESLRGPKGLMLVFFRSADW